MKIPLRYQNTEYDCGTTSFVNALAYLYDREEIPVSLIKMIYQYTLDVEDENGIIGAGGTSRKNAEMLARKFVNFSNNQDFNIKCRILTGEDVTLENIKKFTDENGVVVARCIQEVEHYVIITKIDDTFAYIFDPYYLEEGYYVNDPDIAIVLHQTFTHNRLVKIERLFSEDNKDFSLLSKENREVILINK